MASKSRTIFKKIFKWLGIVLLSLFVLIFLLILALRTPWAQQYITNKAISYVSEKTHTRIELQKLFITFRGDIQLEGIYVEDQLKDTLLFVGDLEAGVAFLPLIDGNINISRINWNGLVANVNRNQDSAFNFDFLIDAFASNAEEDTVAEADSPLPKIAIGPVHFSSFKLHYRDEILGLDAKLDLGKLSLTTDEIDLNTLAIKLDELALENVTLDATKWLETAASEEDTTRSQLPFISWNNINLKNVKLSYRSPDDKLVVGTVLGELAISNSEIDLQKQAVFVNELALKNTVAFAQLPASEPKDTTAVPEPFAWPNWKLKLNKLKLVDNAIDLNVGGAFETPNEFNPSNMRINGLQLLVEDVEFIHNTAKLDVKHLALKEKSGFVLNQLGLKVELNNDQLIVWNLNLQTPFNQLGANVSVDYKSIDSLIQNPLSSSFNLDLTQANLSIQDAYYFAPNLKDDSLLQDIVDYPLKLSGIVSGRMDEITIRNFKAIGLRSTQLSLDGTIRGLPDTGAISVDIPNLKLSLTKKDLEIFIKEKEKTASIPDNMRLTASLKGGVKDLTTKLDLQTEKGNIGLSANLKNLFGIPSAKGKLQLTNIDVSALASVEELATVSLTLDFDATGNALDNLIANLDFAFQQLNFKQYDYSDLKLNVAADKQKANVTAELHDENLDFDLQLEALLDTIKPAANLFLNLRGVNLFALGVSSEDVRLGGDLKASYSGLPSDFQSTLGIKDAILVKEGEVYRLKPLTAKLDNSPKSTFLALNSEIINGNLSANTSIDSIVGSLTNYVKRLASTDSLHHGIMDDSLDVTAHFTINNSLLLTEALLPDLTRLDSIHLDLEFHPSQNKLDLNLIAPKTVYAGITLDSLGLFATANGDHLNGKLAFQKLKGGPIDINRTTVDFGLIDKLANVKLAIADSLGGKLASIGTIIDLTTQNTLVSLIPNDFILNSEQWNIPAENQISFTDKGVIFRSTDFSNAAQRIRLENLKSGNPYGMKVNFEGFELASLTSFLNANDSLISGELNGTLRLLNLNTHPGIEADIKLNQLAVLGLDMGQLKLLANTKDKDKYNLNLTVKGEAIDLEVNGSLISEEEMSLDLKADLHRLDVKLIEGFAGGELQKTSGSILAHTSVKGLLNDIRYEGSVAFNQAAFTVTQLNTQFSLPNDRVTIDNDGLVFKAFNIVDGNGNPIQIDGKIDTRNMFDPSFDLRVVANNFQPLNSTRDDNDLFYGKAFFDADIKLGGKVSLPKINAQTKLLKGTDITFIVPESQADIEERKGLVTFANMKDTLNVILASDKQVEELFGFKGADIVGYLEIDRSTKFQIVIDERSGDKIQIQGEAKLNAEVTPNGIVTLSGNYEVESGFYYLNFYGLAKRKFELVSGSRIVWSGDPLAGELDLKAKYSLKTSASDLMTDQLAQSDATTLTKYKQALPFEVMLNINGELLKPEIFFGIDMPPNARQALDGNVYKRVRQLNGNASELDKQVFSLIVLNRFLPQSFDQMGGSGSQSMARSSASKLLTGQLNALSSKYLKGVELNFDLNSYTDYQSGTADDKTQLDVNIRKALFNDRVVVQVGGQVDIEGKNKSYGADDILGDISLEYLITKEGDYRLKAFRKNEFQDLVQGQVVVMGLSVLFNKSFNDWKELLRSKPKQEEPVEFEDEPEIETEGSKSE